MTRRDTPFVTDGDLIIVEASLTSPRKTVTGRFVLDTGAVFTTMTPELADLIGYSARDGMRRPAWEGERPAGEVSRRAAGVPGGVKKMRRPC